MECEEIIYNALSRLDVEYESPSQVGELEYECLNLLFQLEPECSQALVQMGQELLDHANASEDIEYKFQLVLQALARRQQPDALTLNIEALLSGKTRDKEAYVELLATFENPHAIPALLHAIKADDSIGEEEGQVRHKAIYVLGRLGAKKVASEIVPYVKDSAYRVRSAAIDFLVNFDIREATPVLIDQLREEEDPTNLEKLIFVLVSWKQTEAIHTLQNLLSSDWIRNDKALERKISDAISILDPTKYIKSS